MNYYTSAFKKYAKFSGRASRSEYWYFYLFNLIIFFALAFLEGLLGIYSDSGDSVFGNIYYLIVLIPSIAVGVRRMHDVNKSGWFLVIPIYNLLLLIRKGDDGVNKYGENPLGRIASGVDNVDKKGEKTTKYCSKCGNLTDIDSKFCIKCGNKII